MTAPSAMMKQILFAILITLIAWPVLAADVEPEMDWDNVPASEIHRILWQSKAQAILDQDFSRRLTSSAAITSTQTNYDVLFYDISIRVNDTTEWLYGRVKFVANAAEDGVSEIQVDYYASMAIDSIVAPSGPLAYTRSGDVVTVTLGQTYITGETFEFDFYYNGHPAEDGLQAFAFDWRLSKRVMTTLSEPYFARTWWPCKDRMDDKADSFLIEIIVDTSFYVGSNGTLDSTVDHGDNTHSFYYTCHYPMVTYLFSLAISDYTIWYDEWPYNNDNDTMPLVHAVYPDRYDYSLTKFDITPNALTIFSDQYGQYPFVEEKYGHSNFEWGGAMEHQTMTSTSGGSFGFSEPVVVHELSHQWWGDMITCESWGHIWLNEGWASYSEALYYLEKDGWASYHSYMNGMAYTGSGTIFVTDTMSVWTIFNSNLSYDKGAWVVHMLRGVLGDQVFFDGVDAYYHSEYQHAAATTEKFRDVFEGATGVELDWFFQQWIYGSYQPSFRFSYWEEPADGGGNDVYLAVRQIQNSNPSVFTMPVDFFFDFPGTADDDTLTMWIDQRQQIFPLHFDNSLDMIKLDPSDWVLKLEQMEDWTLHILNTDSVLSEGEQTKPYFDSVIVRTSGSFSEYSITSGVLPAGYTLDQNGVISGSTTEKGQFDFTVYVRDLVNPYSEEKVFSINVIALTDGIPGDVDLSGQVDISDITFFVDYFFGGGPAPAVINLADVDGSCVLDISDLTYLVEYLFGGGPASVPGCVD
jgi:hypothetical protein